MKPEKKEVKDELTWMNVIVRVGLNAVTHPIEYAKVLIQIGHEPLPTYKSKTIFGKEQLFYPSIFSYIKHIKKTDGLGGCFRGLTPKLTGNIISGVTFQYVTNIIEIKNDDKKADELSTEELTMQFLQRTARETVARSVAIIASQPFHVIAVRSMAEFVGNDGFYTGIFTSIGVIYREEGLFGYFAGVCPRILCDIGALWLSNSLIHVLNNYIIEDKDIKTYVTASIKFLASALMYPMQVVSTCMAVTGTGLVAGTPPCMPLYHNWSNCYSHLKSTNSLKRGSTLLWRRYTGPIVMSPLGVPGTSNTFSLSSQAFAKMD